MYIQINWQRPFQCVSLCVFFLYECVFYLYQLLVLVCNLPASGNKQLFFTWHASE